MGILLTHIVQGGLAEKVGLLAGDEVIEINGIKPTSLNHAATLIKKSNKVKLTNIAVLRNKNKVKIVVEWGKNDRLGVKFGSDINQMISNEWIADQINKLWERSTYKSDRQSFLIEPIYFYNIPGDRDKVAFLMKKYKLPLEKIEIYLHAGLDQPGRVELHKIFDTEHIKLQPNQKITSINDDGTFSVLDLKAANDTKIINNSTPLPLKHINVSLYLNQDFIGSKEVMSAIIAHEISHLYLHFNGIQTLDPSSKIKDPFSEHITDIAAFVIGLGSLMLNGCGIKEKTIQQGNKMITIKSRVGYLTIEQMRFAQERVLSYI